MYLLFLISLLTFDCLKEVQNCLTDFFSFNFGNVEIFLADKWALPISSIANCPENFRNDKNCIVFRHSEKQMLQEKSFLAARAKKWPCLPILIWLNLGKSKHRRRFFFQTGFCTQHQSVTGLIGVRLAFAVKHKRDPSKNGSAILAINCAPERE